jgi:ribonuclease HI
VADSALGFVAFFDGGSRGIPGPGEAGAVIVGFAHGFSNATTFWVCSAPMPLPTTTNNAAEYCGLLRTLRAATMHNYKPLHVVGDSAIILAQLRERKPLKARRLLPSTGNASGWQTDFR